MSGLTMREAFVKWAGDNGFAVDHFRGEYTSSDTQAAWEAWQGAKAEEDASQPLVEVQEPAGMACTRSHPHENMDPMCELRTVIARLENEKASGMTPLTEEQIKQVWLDAEDYGDDLRNAIVIARAIEAAHGIGITPKGVEAAQAKVTAIRQDGEP